MVTYPAVESARIPVDIRRFPWIKKLAADYAFAFPALAPFFSGNPADASSWTDAIARAQRHPRDRAAIAGVLREQQSARGAAAASREAAARLIDPQSIAVVTGQQAGLFGGPAFCLYKALTAVMLAERIQREHHVPAVPIFWVDAEDHDWHEVSSCSVLDGELRRRTIQLPSLPGAGHAPIGFITLDGSITGVLDELRETLPPTEFSAGLIADLQNCYQPGRSLADAFARFMEVLLGARGLVVFDCSDRAAKPLVAEIFAREVRQPGRTWALAGHAGQQLVNSGYHQQVVAPERDGVALFHVDGSRSPIPADKAPSLEADVRSKPASYSPNVLLRPIVEDTLFPTVCYVSGPNELAYLAQLKKVYEHFGVPMPLLYPRLSATILDSASIKFLVRHNLPLEVLQARDEATLNRLLADSLPASVDEALKGAERAVEQSMATLIGAVPAVDATLEGAAKSTLGKLQHDLSTLRGKIISAAKKRDETLRRQFGRAQAQAFPDGEPQERAIAGISLLNRHGPALIDQLLAEAMPDLGHHWVLTV